MGFKVVSLFSGCGGLDLGFERAQGNLYKQHNSSPYEVVWANDINEPAMKTFAKNFDFEISKDPKKAVNGKERAYVGDIREISYQEIINEEVQVVLGGFPCKDFSILRGSEDRKGIEVKRGKLYLEYVRALVELQPKIFVAENVKGLVSANDGLAYKKILDDFQNLKSNWPEIRSKIKTNGHKGNDIENYKVIFSEVLDFSEHDVPQMRKRLIMVGVREDVIQQFLQDEQSTDELMEVIQNLEEKKTLHAPLTPIEIFEGKPLHELEEKYKKEMEKFEKFLNKTKSERAEEVRNKVWPQYTMNIMEDYKKLNGLEALKDSEIVELHQKILKQLGYNGEQLRNKKFSDGSNEIMREQSHIKERMKRIPPYENHKMVRGTEHEVGGMMSNIYRRIHPLRPSPTIIAAGGGGTWGYHWEINRQKLTNRERARLQAFPDDFQFIGNNSEVRSQIGNAVPPFASKHIAESLIPLLEKEVSRAASHKKEFKQVEFSLQEKPNPQLELV